MKQTLRKNLFLILIILLASLIYAFKIHDLSVWGDEARTFYHSQSFEKAFKDLHPPYYYLMNFVLIKLDLHDPVYFRLLSSLFIIIGFIFFYKIFKLFSNNEKITLAAMVITVISPEILLYGRMIRYFSLIFMLSAASFYLFFKHFFFSSEVKPVKNLIPFTVVNSLLFAAGFDSIYPFALQFFILLFTKNLRKHIKSFIGSMAVVTLLNAYTIYFFFHVISSNFANLEKHHFLSGSLKGNLLKLIFAYASITVGETFDVDSFFIVLPVGILALLLVLKFIISWKKENLSNRVLFFIILTAPVLVVAVTMFVAKATPLNHILKHILWVIPFYYLFAILVSGKKLLPVVISFYTVLNAYGVLNIYEGQRISNPNYITPWKKINHDITSMLEPGDLVINRDNFSGFRFYFRAPEEVLYLKWPEPQEVLTVLKNKKFNKIFLVIRYNEPRNIRQSEKILSLLKKDYRVIKTLNYVPIRKLTLKLKQKMFKTKLPPYYVVVFILKK